MTDRFHQPDADSRGAPGRRRCAPLLTPRDLALLDALTLRTKVISVDQAARWFWGGLEDRDAARRRLRNLEKRGLVESVRLSVAPECALVAPLVTWVMGERVPDWTAILKWTRSRWDSPLESVQCFVATALSAARFGVSPRPPRLSEATHDLHVAQVYLRLRRRDPAAARRWEGEAPRCREEIPGAKVPDALLRRAGRSVAIEVVGSSYSGRKLAAFHGFCAARGLGYELW